MSDLLDIRASKSLGFAICPACLNTRHAAQSLCGRCSEFASQGIICVGGSENYRDGNWAVTTPHRLEAVFYPDELKHILHQRWVYLNQQQWKLAGLPKRR